MRVYIEIDSDSYIIGWSTEKFSEDMIEIEHPGELYGALGYVKYSKGTLIVDEVKKEELSKIIYSGENAVKEITELKKENSELKRNQEIQNEAIAELADVVAGMAGE